MILWQHLQIYNPLTDSWKQGTPLPFGRSGMGAAVSFKGKFYIFGGEEYTRTYSNKERVFSNTQIYDINREEWEEGPTMPQGIHGSYPILDRSQEQIYLVGGGDSWGDSATAVRGGS